MKVLITGVAGLIGSHLAELLLERGDEVVGIDNFLTGSRTNVDLLGTHSGFRFIEADASMPYDVRGPIDAICHLASPASPTDFAAMPVEILRVGSAGTLHALEFAQRHNARFVMASTSEVYGDPAVNPQDEAYWGNVNPIGPRSCYDEAKRFSEAATAAFRRSFDVNTGIVRIFNTYGPRMRPDDGRVVSNFVVQAIRGEALTVYGDGNQTRSFCFVSDEARGILAFMDTDHPGPINLGNPNEFTVLELAHMVRDKVGKTIPIHFADLPVDDPRLRCPDISLATRLLSWKPTVEIDEGLDSTIDYFSRLLA